MAWGCDEPSQEPVKEVPDDDGGVVVYHSCPILFIPRSVSEFLDMRNHLRKYPHTAPKYEEVNPRFRVFDNYLDATISRFEDMVRRDG